MTTIVTQVWRRRLVFNPTISKYCHEHILDEADCRNLIKKSVILFKTWHVYMCMCVCVRKISTPLWARQLIYTLDMNVGNTAQLTISYPSITSYKSTIHVGQVNLCTGIYSSHCAWILPTVRFDYITNTIIYSGAAK